MRQCSFFDKNCHKVANIGKNNEELWQKSYPMPVCAHFDGFMSKIDFLPFLVILAGKQTNICQN